jgi:hypothetical protein
MEKVQEATESRPSFEIFRDGNTVRYFIGVPNSEQVRKSEWHYAKVFNKAMVEGISTSAEMLGILEARGLYGNDYDEQLDHLRDDVVKKLQTMLDTQDSLQQYNLAKHVAEARAQLYKWNAKLTGPMRNTCEQIAEDAKVEFLTSQLIQTEDGKQVWKTFDEFLAEPDQGLALQARMEVYLALQGIDKEFLARTPEKAVMDEYEAAAKNPPAVKELEAAAQEEKVVPLEQVEEVKPVRTRAKKKAI